MSHIYRAYYAIQGLTNRQGLSTNAVFGFTTMLRKLMQDEHPEYLAVTLESKGPTVRHEQFREYKAHRPKMPEDLAEQLPYILRLCEAMKIPVLRYEGYEADDVIGTLSTLAEGESGLDVVIVTIDKDLLQLVNDRISVLDTRSDTRYTPQKVEEKWGVRPDQIIDVLSLIGDTSDNIPGAPGIGDKGAKSLIAEFGGLDALLENSSKVSRKSYRTSLQENEASIRQSRELLRVYRDLPLELDLKQLEVEEPDLDALRGLFQELDFTTLLDDLPNDSKAPELRVNRIGSREELESLWRRIEGSRTAVAVWYREETEAANPFQGIALCDDPKSACFIPAEVIAVSSDLLEQMFWKDSPWVFHDLKPWLLAAHRAGWKLDGMPGALDTMLMAYLLEPNQRDFSLQKVAESYLGLNLESQATGLLLQNERPMDLCRQAMGTLLLTRTLLPRVREKGLERLLLETEMPLVQVLADMEWTGVRVDTELLDQISRELDTEIASLSAKIFRTAGEEFNLNSPRQLAHILFEKLNLPSSRRTGKAGHYSTGVEVLEELAYTYDIAQQILDYRELAKLKGTYADALPKLVDPRSGRIHTSYNQMVASTGRLSSSNPNLQNIPIRTEQGRRIRRAFVAEPGWLMLSADYSQIELRVMAHLSEDPVLVEAFRNDEDIHERTAREVFGPNSPLDPREQRRRAKVINFGIMYGLSAYGLAKGLKIERSEAQRFIDDYFQRYSGVSQWIQRTLEDAEKCGYVVTLFGRIRQIPEISSRNRNLREFARRTAINAPIQGTAADLIKMAMVSISRRLRREGWKSKLTMQVHDELVFEAEPGEVEALGEAVREEMEGVVTMSVPLKVDLHTGASWYEAK